MQVEVDLTLISTKKNHVVLSIGFRLVVQCELIFVRVNKYIHGLHIV